MLLLGALHCGKAKNFISHNDLLIRALLPLHLIKHVEKLIKSVQQHLGLVPITHHILVVQGAGLHSGGLEWGDALIPPSQSPGLP